MTTDAGARIERARVAAGHSQRSLAEVAGISQPTLSRIISGDRPAKMSELVAISWATGHTIAQLTGAETVADRVECSARATCDCGMNVMREKLLHFLELDDYLQDQAIPATRQPERPSHDLTSQRSKANAEAMGRDAAARFRAEHQLGVQPLGDLIAIIEHAIGIDVAVLSTGPDEHGLTMWDTGRDTVFVGVARTDKPMRQRSTLAHELGHVLFDDRNGGDGSNWSARTPEEIRADAFARHLLVPAEGLRQFVTDRVPVTESVLSDVVERFLVPPQIAAIALHQTEYIDDDTKQRWMGLATPALAVRFGWADYYRTLQMEANQLRAPQRLLARTIRGYTEGVASAQAIATLRGIAMNTVEVELREAGIQPIEVPIAWATPDELPAVHVDMAALDAALAAPVHDDERNTDNDGG
ncbi:MAG TPA: XRE family transcriptional regulator [Pseudonocardiaceae bacterium]|nr:XRE family transcriptional regulator [Pseudonocardiaceae bacterium]